ncbi:MAG: GspH/FimT family pseudopilin [Aquabacterium sp.]|uniref:GspH/FimT family pseudopilin n=1 Tax=Aquabacterium sp. TaxID=1872578 RepID=UPI002722D862|nr:GspH/FimT family pseudopilin [Aquabacterium sp.]MDO9005180.1 GspH/FimT family pseudopilin [Aquabacterium sp.]
MKTQRGFSMIEVVVTIAIMGILMAAAMPSVGDWLRNAKVRNTADSLLNGLQQARSVAVNRNRPTTLYLVNNLTGSCALSNAAGSWVVSHASPVGQCDSTTVVLAKGSVLDGGGATVTASQSNYSAGATAVTFNGLGMLAQSSLSTAIRRIVVASADGSYDLRIEISPGGAARLCEPRIDTTGDSRKCLQ